MISVTKLVRERLNEAGGFVEHECYVVALTDGGVGLQTGESETTTDQRDGREVEREKLLWLPRSKVRVLSGTLGKNENVVLAVPRWLAKNKGIIA